MMDGENNTMRLDLIGHKYGLLTVVSFNGKSLHKNGRYYYEWNCSCECGSGIIKVACTANLRSGLTSSCGCLRIIKNKKFGQRRRESADFTGLPAFMDLYNKYRLRAERMKFTFDLNEDTFRKLTKSNCYFCNVEPKQKNQSERAVPYIYNGIDRLDNNLGYTTFNSVPCCGICNKAKRDLSVPDFQNWILRLKTSVENKIGVWNV